MALRTEEIEELRESFSYNDVDDDGRIGFEEFFNMLEQLDARISREEARIGFREIDEDGSGSVDFDEFVAWWRGR